MKNLTVVLLTAMLLTGCSLFQKPTLSDQEIRDIYSTQSTGMEYGDLMKEMGKLEYHLSVTIHLKNTLPPEVFKSIDWDEVEHLYEDKSYRDKEYSKLDFSN